MRRLVCSAAAVAAVLVLVCPLSAAERGTARGVVVKIGAWTSDDGQMRLTVTIRTEGIWQATFSVGAKTRDAFATVGGLRKGDRITVAWVREGDRNWIREIGRQKGERAEGDKHRDRERVEKGDREHGDREKGEGDKHRDRERVEKRDGEHGEREEGEGDKHRDRERGEKRDREHGDREEGEGDKHRDRERVEKRDREHGERELHERRGEDRERKRERDRERERVDDKGDEGVERRKRRDRDREGDDDERTEKRPDRVRRERDKIRRDKRDRDVPDRERADKRDGGRQLRRKVVVQKIGEADGQVFLKVRMLDGDDTLTFWVHPKQRELMALVDKLKKGDRAVAAWYQRGDAHKLREIVKID